MRSVQKTKVQIFSVWNEQLVIKSFIVQPQYNSRKIFGMLSESSRKSSEKSMEYQIKAIFNENLTKTLQRHFS